MAQAAEQAGEVLSFGPFRLALSQRLLTKNGAPVELGSRTLDALIALASRPNEIVSKRDLMADVWPDVTVEESSLRFHIAALRKALADGEKGARYITTATGRGYCFVAAVSRSGDQGKAHVRASASFSHSNLPGRLMRMVGRADDVLKLSAQLTATRFVSIVGVGGVGKTAVAIAVGHHLLETFNGAVLFVDLGMLSDPALAATAVASLLGLTVQSDDATPSLVAYLRERRILLILDTCEHLIDAVAALASSLFAAAPQIYILATSREALRVPGEHVYRLETLACPPEDLGLTAAAAQTFPATQLFLERAEEGGARLNLGEADTAIVVNICRRLDGVALAIEIAARGVEAYGLRQTAALLDQRLTFLWLGPRGSPPRQRTLQATLDWSYGLLSELERVVLRRLAVFVGHFTLDAALAVVTSATIDQARVFAAIDSLLAKSMVASQPIGGMMRYRLLDTTRAYVLETSIAAAELADLAVRHAAYYGRWLEQFGTDWPGLSTGAERAPHFAALNNVRAALEWCFRVDGNLDAGVRLVAAAAPVFLAMSLLPECHRWSERALQALDDDAREGLDEMHLQAALGVSLMSMHGGNDAARVALNRSFGIAERKGGALDQLRLLGPLNLFHLRTGEFKAALQFARRCSALAGAMHDPAAATLAHSVLGLSLHLAGDLGGARRVLEAAVRNGPRTHHTTTIYLGMEGKILAGAILGRTLWLQGHPSQAVERTRKTVMDAADMDHSLSLSVALVWGISVFFWIGDLESAEEHIDRLNALAESRSMTAYFAVGRGFKAALAIRRGDASGGVESLQSCLQKLHAIPYELQTTMLNISLVQGLTAIGNFAEGMRLINETIGLVDTNGDAKNMPEVLRVKGGLLLSMPQPRGDEAEMCFKQSLELSRRQGALSWELRTAVDLATLRIAQGRPDSARKLLQPVFEQFVEGWDTADLRTAARLLATLG